MKTKKEDYFLLIGNYLITDKEAYFLKNKEYEKMRKELKIK